jgi:hypothetical protein
MLWGISDNSLAIVRPPRPAGQMTDVTNFGQGKSCRVAETSQEIETDEQQKNKPD